MMTVLRVLPDDLYDRVVSGNGEIKPGASVPGGGPGKEMGGHEGHTMPGMKGMEGMEGMHQHGEQKESVNGGSHKH